MPDKKRSARRSVKLTDELAKIIDNLYDTRKKKFGFWYNVVGDRIAAAAEPVRLINSVLYIRVKDSVWRFELARRKEELIDKINNSPDSGEKIKDIVFK